MLEAEELRQQAAATLDAVETLVHALARAEGLEAMTLYAAARALMGDLRRISRDDIAWAGGRVTHPTANVSQYMGELRRSVRGLAGLNGHDGIVRGNHTTWALSAVRKLRSEHAFGVDAHA